MEFVKNVAAVLTALLSALTLLGIVLAFVKKPWKAWIDLRKKVETIDGNLLPRHELIEMGLDIKHVKDQLGRNGGESVRDAIDRIEDTTAGMEAKLRSVSNVCGEPIFETDHAGNITFVNERLEELTGLHLDQVRGLNWVSAIAIDQRDVFRREFMSAISDQREFSAEVSIVGGGKHSDRLIRLRVHMWPVKQRETGSSPAKLIGMTGLVRELQFGSAQTA